MDTKRIAAVICGAALIGAAVPASATADTGAPAKDPGFCGVRYDAYPGPQMQEVYVVQNQCDHAVSFRVHIPAENRDAAPGCQSIAPHTLGYYTDTWVVPDWTVYTC